MVPSAAKHRRISQLVFQALTILRLSAWSPQHHLSRREVVQQASATAGTLVFFNDQIARAAPGTDTFIIKPKSSEKNDDSSDSSLLDSDTDSDFDSDFDFDFDSDSDSDSDSDFYTSSDTSRSDSAPRGWMGFVRVIPHHRYKK